MRVAVIPIHELSSRHADFFLVFNWPLYQFTNSRANMLSQVFDTHTHTHTHRERERERERERDSQTHVRERTHTHTYTQTHARTHMKKGWVK